jgi:hypothetical protein
MEKMGRGGAKIKLTDEERLWTEEAFKRIGSVASHARIRDNNLIAEYKKKFGKKITEAALGSRFTKLAARTGTVTPRGKGKIDKVFEKSPYLAYLKNGGVYGFETEDEVKAFIEKSGILGNILVFKRMDVEVKYDIRMK